MDCHLSRFSRRSTTSVSIFGLVHKPQKTDTHRSVGAILFVIGALPILMGVVWTTVLPSNDRHIIISLVLGFFFMICFALWETFAKIKHPLTPRYVFASSYGRDFTAPAIVLAVVNMFYYSGSILWPTIVSSFYTTGGTD